MHPVKSVHAIRDAAHKLSISHFVVDHPDELAKVLIHTMPHKPVIMIRLAMPRNMAVYDLGGKFGCSTAEAVALARAVSSEGLAVGFCFHVGSQCLEPAAYTRALALVGDVVRSAKIHPEIIDVGGGFPAAYRNVTLPPLSEYVGAILSGMAQIKLDYPTRLLAEPGRSLAAPSASLIVKVELRRGNKLYLNDGMSGGLSELRFAGIDVPMRVWRVNGAAKILTSSQDDFRFCGPTCDSADVIEGPFALASDIQNGDYIEFGQMGAYSISMRSDFNGFLKAAVVNVKDSAFLP
jgi:ornithine decarboxylase